MDKIYGFTEHDLKRVVQTVLRSERAPRGYGSGGDANGGCPVQWFPFRNDNGSTVSGRSIMRVTGSTTFSSAAGGSDDQLILTCDQPNTTFYRHYAVCEASDVASGDYGLCALSGLLECTYDTGTPAIGEEWGPKPSQFTLSKGYPGCFTVLGILDSTNKWMLGYLHPIDRIIGKLAGTLSQGGSATVNVWQSATPGSEAVITSMTVTAYDWLMKSGATAIASGKKVVVQWINGVWYVTEAECS